MLENGTVEVFLASLKVVDIFTVQPATVSAMIEFQMEAINNEDPVDTKIIGKEICSMEGEFCAIMDNRELVRYPPQEVTLLVKIHARIKRVIQEENEVDQN